MISRNSTFTYKGKPVKVKQVSEELGVRYVLEGSLQRSGDRVRVTAQLIDALTGNHLWAERYDRDLKDIFALQDEITIKILTAVQVKLTGGDVTRAQKYAEKYYKGKQGLDCYLKLTEAEYYRERWNIEDNNRPGGWQRKLLRCVQRIPRLIFPSVGSTSTIIGWAIRSPLGRLLRKSIELAQKAIAMDESISSAHALLSNLYSTRGEHDKAIAEGERAMTFDPGGPWAIYRLCRTSKYCRPAGGSHSVIPKSNPTQPPCVIPLYIVNSAMHFGDTERFEEAVSAYKKAIQVSPNDISAHMHLALTYSYDGPREGGPC